MAVCEICKKKISPQHKIVRMVVEVVYCGKDDDANAPECWSEVEEWTDLVMMHLGCVKEAFDNDEALPYGNEVNELPIDEIDNVPIFAGKPCKSQKVESFLPDELVDERIHGDKAWMNQLYKNGNRLARSGDRILGVIDGGFTES